MTTLANGILTIINDMVLNSVNAGLINTPDDLIALINFISREINLDPEIVKSVVFKIVDKLEKM